MLVPAHPLVGCLIENPFKKKVSNTFFQHQHLLQIKTTPGFFENDWLCAKDPAEFFC